MQYTVPDAKVQGRKVQVTCKHCRTSFVIDGTAKAQPAPLPNLPSLMGSESNDDATRVVGRPDFSVHDEPTVVGQIPAAALEAERRYAQRTVPPPANGAASTAGPAPRESEPVPTPAAERALPPYASEATLLIAPPAAAQPSLPAPPTIETTPFLAEDFEGLFRPNRKRAYVLLAVAAVLVAGVALALSR